MAVRYGRIRLTEGVHRVLGLLYTGAAQALKRFGAAASSNAARSRTPIASSLTRLTHGSKT